jgi:fluoride ion exporter CrcB/FEX
VLGGDADDVCDHWQQFLEINRLREELLKNLIEGTKPTTASPWLISVSFLSLPSVIFMFLHALYAPGVLPEFLGFVVTWAIIALTGFLGAARTLSACVVSAVATLQNDVPRTAKAAMWGLVSLAFVACLYLATVRP